MGVLELEFLRSPAEISTLFLVLTIGLYVFLFWRSQIHAQHRYNTNRGMYRRRISDRILPQAPAEQMALNHLFEDDGDKDHATTH